MAIAVSNSVSTPIFDVSNGTFSDEFIIGLVQGGSWTFSGPRVITYSFNINDDGSYPEGDIGQGAGGTWDLSPQFTTAVTQALAAWASIANVTFAEDTGSNGSYYFQSSADLAFTLTGNDLESAFGAAALGFFPDPTYVAAALDPYTSAQYPNMEGNIFLDNYSTQLSSVTPGSIGFEIILHEIGHALGLKHTDDDGGNNKPNFSTLGIGSYDTTAYTIMGSYVSDNPTHAATPMLADILAIQHIYGANMSYHTGNDTYTLGNGFYNAIWDAGGVDGIDAISWPGSDGVLIDLNAGAFSGARLGEKTTGIAYGVTIENASGTVGPDQLIGNSVDNKLLGGAGNDTLDGGAGNDTLDGGNDTNFLSGGSGNDTYVIDSSDVLSEVSGIDTVRAYFSYTLPGAFEGLVLTGTDNITGTGNALDNILSGNSGANTLDGSTGADIIAGGSGNDTYVIDNSGDQVMELPSSGIDTVQSVVTYSLMQAWHVENLTLTGNGNIDGTGNWLNNVLTGNSVSNVLDGNAGNDTLNGGTGNDTLIGGAGDDVLVYDYADGSIQGGAGTDTLRLDGSGVTLNLAAISDSLIQDVEIIDIGGSGNNTLTLTLADVLAISSTTDALRIDGNAGDVVNAGSGWTTSSDQAIGPNTYHTYTQGLATLLVDTDITANVSV